MRQVRSPARTHHFAIIVSRVAAIGVGDIGLRYHFRRQVAARFLLFASFAKASLCGVFAGFSTHLPSRHHCTLLVTRHPSFRFLTLLNQLKQLARSTSVLLWCIAAVLEHDLNKSKNRRYACPKTV